MTHLTEEQMKEGLSIIDGLVVAARQTLDKIPTNDDHSVVSAARTKGGHVITGFNVYHFTGGPCAEPVVFGAAAAQGHLPKDLTHIVAVVNSTRDVISPCGRCRQMFVDLCPGIVVGVKDEGELRAVSVTELMPFAYVNLEG